jgi:hypothetical protein
MVHPRSRRHRSPRRRRYGGDRGSAAGSRARPRRRGRDCARHKISIARSTSGCVVSDATSNTGGRSRNARTRPVAINFGKLLASSSHSASAEGSRAIGSSRGRNPRSAVTPKRASVTFSAAVMEASHGVTRICHSPSNLLRPSPMTQLPTDTGCRSGSVVMSPGNWGRRTIRPAGHPSERGADNSSFLEVHMARVGRGVFGQPG